MIKIRAINPGGRYSNCIRELMFTVKIQTAQLHNLASSNPRIAYIHLWAILK